MLHFRLLDDERNSLAGDGAIELFDSRAAPPAGAESIRRASEMVEDERTHTAIGMSVIEYTVQALLPPSLSEPTLVVRQRSSNAFLISPQFGLVAGSDFFSTERTLLLCLHSSTTLPTGTKLARNCCLCSPCGSPSRCCVQVWLRCLAAEGLPERRTSG